MSMTISTKSIVCQASTTNILDSLLEWVKEDIDQLRNHIDNLPTVTHLGMGVRFDTDITPSDPSPDPLALDGGVGDTFVEILSSDLHDTGYQIGDRVEILSNSSTEEFAHVGSITHNSTSGNACLNLIDVDANGTPYQLVGTHNTTDESSVQKLRPPSGDLHVDVSCRVDILSIDINPSSSAPPAHPTPKVKATASIGRQSGSEGAIYLLNGPSDPTHLRSAEVNLSWSPNDGFEVNASLYDAAFAGVYDWSGNYPGCLSLDMVTDIVTGLKQPLVDPGLYELLNAFLTHYSEIDDSGQLEFLLELLEALKLASSQISMISGNPVKQWSIQASTIDCFINDPLDYLNQLFTNAYGDWAINEFDIRTDQLTGDLVSTNLFNILTDNIALLEPDLYSEDSMIISIPLPGPLQPIEITIHASGEVETTLLRFEQGRFFVNLSTRVNLSQLVGGGSNIDVTATLLAGMLPRSSGDISFAFRCEYDRLATIPVTLDFELSGLDEIFDFDPAVSNWVSIPSSITLFPPTDPAKPFEELKDMLLLALPTLGIQSMAQLLIERFLLSKLDDRPFIGDVLDVLGLVETIDGLNYTCTSWLPIISDPLGYLENIFLTDQGGIRARPVIDIAHSIFTMCDIPIREEFATVISGPPALTEVAMSIEVNGNQVAEFCIMESQATANALCLAIQTPPGSPLVVSKSTGDILELELQACLTIDANLSLSAIGSGARLVFYPARLCGSTQIGAVSLANDAYIALDFEISDTSPTLELEISLDGTPQPALTLLPELSGWNEFISSLLSGTLEFLLPKLLTKLLHMVYENDPTLGLKLMDIAIDLGLWDDTLPAFNADAYYSGSALIHGTFIEAEIQTLAQDPKLWIENNLAPLLGTAVNVLLSQIFPLPDGGTLGPIFAAKDMGTYTRLALYTFDGTNVVNASNGGLLDRFAVEIGEKSGDYGIWLSYSPSFDLNQHVIWGPSTSPPIFPASTVDSVGVPRTSSEPEATWTYTVSTGLPSLAIQNRGEEYSIGDRLAFSDPSMLPGSDIEVVVDTIDSNGAIISFHANTRETELPNLDLYLEAGIAYDNGGSEWGASVKLNVWADGDFFNGNGPVTMRPCLMFGFQSDVVSLSLATNYDDNGLSLSDGDNPSLTIIGSSPVENAGFWIELLPAIDCGAPTLLAMLADMADVALSFVAEIQDVQDWLNTPLYQPSPSNDIKDALSDCSVPGRILVAIGVMAHYQLPTSIYEWPGTSPPPPSIPDQGIFYMFRKITYSGGGAGIPGDWVSGINGQGIMEHFNDPLGALLDGLFCLLDGALASSISDSTNSTNSAGLTLFEHLDGDIPFTISLVDKDPASGSGQFGIRFWFDEVVVKDDLLKLFFQDGTDLEEWTPGEGFIPGVTLYFVEWDSVSGVTPLLSLEIAGLGLEVAKGDGKPLLEKFLCLNKVSLVTALDLNILPAYPTKFGGQLILDDFGIELGGDGGSDGGNGMAAGLLKGGEDGKDAVKPSFDLYLSKFDNNPFEVAIKDGQAEFWFPINKDFGPLKIEQIGVRYFQDPPNGGEHRLGILIDGSAEVAGFMAQVDDLMVSFPLLDPFDFDSWKFDLAGLAIAYDSDSFSIAGALRKEGNYAFFPSSYVGEDFATGLNPIPKPTGLQYGATFPPGMEWALEYAEYQGLCTITTDTLGISAVGAFARVPNADGTGFVSVFVIAALNMPLGGPPFFFVTGLLGGLGLNRQLTIPAIQDVPQHLFIQTLGGTLADNPMGALDLIKTQFPIEHGSFWFAVGLKFTSFQIIESRAVLFIKIDTGVTIGIVALSAMSLPSKECNIGYVELAILAYYSSEEQVLWVQAQLTDASYLFSKSCRLTGGFALVTWFKTGEFLLSLGGYHPRFRAPDYYPVVPRIGFNWKPISCITIKGGAYFTLCSSAVMLGGGLDASFNKGMLSAGFRMGLDVLVVFDPFYYDFEMYIELYVRFKCYIKIWGVKIGKTFKASIGADLQIEGPEMRGTARLSLAFVSFTVKFGSQNPSSFAAISGTQFLNKHVRQLPEAEVDDAPSNEWKTTDFMNANVLKGVARPPSAKNDDGTQKDGLPTGEDDSDPWLLEPEFDFMLGHKFPATSMRFNTDKGTISRSFDQMDLAAMRQTGVDSIIEIDLHRKVGNSWEIMDDYDDYCHSEGITIDSRQSFFPDTIWSYIVGPGGKPQPKKSAGEQLQFLSSYVISGRCYFEDPTDNLNLEGKVEPCEMTHYIPMHEASGINIVFVGPIVSIMRDIMALSLANYQQAVTEDDSNKGLMSAMIKMIYDDDAEFGKQVYINETRKVDSFHDFNEAASRSAAGSRKNQFGAIGNRRGNAKAGGDTR